MRRILFVLILIMLSCESQSFESDRRQLIAKDEIRRQLHNVQSFEIAGFKEDTVENFSTTLPYSLRYQLDVVYKDSTGQVQKKKGIVLFTPDGRSVLQSNVIDQR